MLGRIAKVTIILMAVTAVIASNVAAQAPTTISYQGRLTNAAGQPITAATSVVFTIYDLASGGSSLYTVTQSITPDANGVFTAELGPIGASVFDGTKRYLGIKAGDDAEMRPRQVLTSAPYSFNSNSIADNAITSTKIADGAVGTADIANGGVGNADLAADAVTTDKIAAGAVATADIAASAVGTTQIADNAITSVKIADGAVGTADIAAGAVANADIAAGAVSADKIADEPGFSQTPGTTNTTYPLTGAGQAFASVTLNAPAAGYALVIGSAVSWVVHTNGQWDNNIYTVSKVSGDVASGNYGLQIVTLPAAFPTTGTEFRVPVVIHQIFTVTAGNNTFYLNGYDSNTTGNDLVFRPRITAIYLPSQYGTIEAAPSETGGDQTSPDLSTHSQGGQ